MINKKNRLSDSERSESVQFEKDSLKQLNQIFKVVGKESNEVRHGNLSSKFDIIAKSDIGRELLIECKYLGRSKRLSTDTYISLAALKKSFSNEATEYPPIIVVFVNSEVDASTARTFKKSGIPIVTLGESVDITKERLSNTFQDLAIFLPELFPQPQQILDLELGNCFISVSSQYKEWDRIFRESVEPALVSANLKPIFPDWEIEQDQPSIDKIYELINQSDIILADFTEFSPNLNVETGAASFIGKDVIIIIQSRSRNLNISGSASIPQIIYYEDTQIGLEKLKALLLEALVTIRQKQLDTK